MPKIFKNIVVVSISKLMTASIALVAIPVFTQIYEDLDFKAATLFLVFFAIAQAFEQSLTFGVARYFSFSDDSQSKLMEVKSSILFSLVLVAFVSLFLIFVFNPYQASLQRIGFVDGSHLQSLSSLFLVSVVSRLMLFLPKGAIVGHHEHIKLAAVDALTIPVVFFGVFLFISQPSLVEYFTFHAGFSVISVCIYYLVAGRRIFESLRSQKLKLPLKIGVLRYLMASSVIAGITATSGGIDRILLSSIVGSDYFSIYTICYTLGSTILLAASPLIQVIIPQANSLVQSGDFVRSARGLSNYLVIVGTVGTLFFVIFFDEIIRLIFGLDEIPAYGVVVLILLCSSFVFSAMSYPLHATQMGLGHTGFAVVAPIAMLVALVSVLSFSQSNSAVFVCATTLMILNCVNVFASQRYTLRMIPEIKTHLYSISFATELFRLPLLLLAVAVGCGLAIEEQTFGLNLILFLVLCTVLFCFKYSSIRALLRT